MLKTASRSNIINYSTFLDHKLMLYVHQTWCMYLPIFLICNSLIFNFKCINVDQSMFLSMQVKCTLFDKHLPVWYNIAFIVIPITWPWSYGSWIYNYLYNQCLSLLKMWVRTPAHGEVYSIQHYAIKFVSELRQIGNFLMML